MEPAEPVASLRPAGWLSRAVRELVDRGVPGEQAPVVRVELVALVLVDRGVPVA